MASLLEDGIWGGAFAIHLFGMAGGCALSGRGPAWGRVASGVVALVPTPIWAMTATLVGGHGIASTRRAAPGSPTSKRPPGNVPAQPLAVNPDVTLTDEPTALAAICTLDDGAYRLSLSVAGQPAVEAIDTDPYAPGLTGRAATEDAGSTRVVRSTASR